MYLAIQPGTELEQEVQRGEFVLPSPMQLLEEERYLLENLSDFDCYYWGDHGNNLARAKGMLPGLRNEFLANLNHTIAHHPGANQHVIQTFAW